MGLMPMSSGLRFASALIAGRHDKHLSTTLALLRRSPQVDLLEIDYRALIHDTTATLAQIVSFLGPAMLPHAEAMAGVIDAGLHRQRV